jgi:hypothetical protein
MSPLDRRTFLKGAGAGAAALLIGFDTRRSAATPQPFGMAMHIHSSFSEGAGTMLAQLTQARANGVDVLWWTDHDWRMSGQGYWQLVHFSGFSESMGPIRLQWNESRSGSLASASSQIVSSPASPADPGSRAMRIAATGSGSAFAYLRRLANTSGGRQNLLGTLAGTTISLDVFPQSIGPNAFMEVRVQTGYRPATGGRGAGPYVLSYRIGGPGTPGSAVAQGLTGVVTLSAPTNAWTTIDLTPVADVARIWPDLVADDTQLVKLFLGVGSRNRSAGAGVFDRLRFTRTYSRDAVDVQRAIANAYATSFPDVVQHQGLEVSLHDWHVNRFGGQVTIPDYGDTPILPVPNDPAVLRTIVSDAHATGGVIAYNHLFGTSGGTASVTQQESLRRSVASRLITERLYGADLVEVGYRLRGGVQLARHLAVWDACSRNSIFATGTGTSDDHSGQGWLTQQNNFLTWAWAEDSSEPSLLAALSAGRCYFGDLRRFAGQLDLTVDGVHPMGSVSVSTAAARELGVLAAGLPTGARVRLVSGPVDDAGASTPDPGTTWQDITAAIVGGQALLPLPNDAERFARLEVYDASGVMVAGSNPVWLLHDAPADGIPPARGG